MNKGRKTRCNLRQKFQALSSSSGKKKGKHSTKHKNCTCPPEYFDLATGFCSCTCHVQDNTALSSHQRVSPSILEQDSTSHFATQAGQTSPFPSYLATQAVQTSPIPSYHATQAAQLSHSTSQFATQAGPPSPSASPPTSLSELPASNPPDQLPKQSPPLDSTPDRTDTSDSGSETDNEDETTPLLSLPLRKTKSLALTDKAKLQDSSDEEDKEYIRPCS